MAILNAVVSIVLAVAAVAALWFAWQASKESRRAADFAQQTVETARTAHEADERDRRMRTLRDISALVVRAEQQSADAAKLQPAAWRCAAQNELGQALISYGRSLPDCEALVRATEPRDVLAAAQKAGDEVAVALGLTHLTHLTGPDGLSHAVVGHLHSAQSWPGASTITTATTTRNAKRQGA